MGTPRIAGDSSEHCIGAMFRTWYTARSGSEVTFELQATTSLRTEIVLSVSPWNWAISSISGANVSVNDGGFGERFTKIHPAHTSQLTGTRPRSSRHNPTKS